MPNYDESVKPIFNGMDKLPEVVFPYIIESLVEPNLSQNLTKVGVNFDGSIDELPRQKINYEKTPSASKVEPFQILKVKTYSQEVQAGVAV